MCLVSVYTPPTGPELLLEVLNIYLDTKLVLQRAVKAMSEAADKPETPKDGKTKTPNKQTNTA